MPFFAGKLPAHEVDDHRKHGSRNDDDRPRESVVVIMLVAQTYRKVHTKARQNQKPGGEKADGFHIAQYFLNAIHEKLLYCDADLRTKSLMYYTI